MKEEYKLIIFNIPYFLEQRKFRKIRLKLIYTII